MAQSESSGESSFTSRLDELLAADAAATDAGLIGAAQILVNAVRRGLRGGFTSGQFTTGAAVNSVTRSEPASGDGVRAIAVGTNLNSPPYLLFWELGHHNVFTRRYERKEVWRPALADNLQQISDAFARLYRRVMEERLGAAAPGAERDRAVVGGLITQDPPVDGEG